MSNGHAHAWLAVTGAIAICVGLGACGGSSAQKTVTGQLFSVGTLNFSRCMRAHSVSGFPDPGVPVSGPHNSFLGISIPPSINTEAPVYQAALRECSRLLSNLLSPAGRPGITPTLKASLIAQAQCMRDNGIPDFPDPTFPASGGIATQDPPGVNEQSPAFLHAQAVCQKR